MLHGVMNPEKPGGMDFYLEILISSLDQLKNLS